jgi:hypothetical protein
VALAATVVTLLLLGATGPETLDATPTAGPTGIKLYPDANMPKKVGAVFKTCHVSFPPGAMDIHSTTADDKWDLEVYLKPWTKNGIKQTYILQYGKTQPGAVKVSGVGEAYGTAFPPPSGIYVHPAGKVAFISGGSVVTVAAATFDGPYTKSVFVEGACALVR